MKAKSLCFAVAAACLCAAVCAGPVTVSANSAQTHWQGVDAFGAVVQGGDCPIEVGHETLTFDLDEFPSNDYGRAEDFFAYGGSVSAEYTFRNPADYAVKATLAFPFGLLPSYVHMYSEEEELLLSQLPSRFGVTVNGEAVSCTVRHTYHPEYSQFSVESDIPRLRDGMVGDGLFLPGTEVKLYTFEAYGVDDKTYPSACAAFDISPEGPCGVVCGDVRGASFEDGKYRIKTGVGSGGTLEIYMIGEHSRPQLTFYRDGGCEDGEEIAGGARLLSETSLSFEEFALAQWSEDSGISRTDYYNAYADKLASSLVNDEVAVCNERALRPGELMRWYEYELEFAPGETLVNRVEAPIYPEIDMGYKPALYTYTYLLSPASTWKSFGSLDVIINTPFYVIGGEGFTETENGYAKSFDGLPEGELVFSLASSPEVEGPSPFGGLGYFLAMFGVPILIALFVITGVVIVAALLLYRSENRKK